MTPSSQIRKEVMAEVIDTYRAAKAQGVDAWKAVETAYPGIPSNVVAEAMMAVENEVSEAWWQTVGRTIEGEIIRNALGKASA